MCCGRLQFVNMDGKHHEHGTASLERLINKLQLVTTQIVRNVCAQRIAYYFRQIQTAFIYVKSLRIHTYKMLRGIIIEVNHDKGALDWGLFLHLD